MADRRFKDREGRSWDVRVRSRADWLYEPVDDNPGPARTGAAPGYETDPFELSVEELQQLLDDAKAPESRQKKSPFLD